MHMPQALNKQSNYSSNISPRMLSEGSEERPYVTPADFGAVADGETMDTVALQAAIDFAAEQPCVLFIPSGRYLSGSLHLRSNLSMKLAQGAVLVASANPEDYELLEESEDESRKQREHFFRAFLRGQDLKNVRLSGNGVLDGNGERVSDEWPRYFPLTSQGKIDEKLRPPLIHLIDCQNCEVSGITLYNPASWTQNYVRCRGLRLENQVVEAVSAWNNDGIDICDCQDVIIRGCRINSADDGICLKSSGAIVQDVVVSDCVVRSSASAIKFGTASSGGFRNIAITNIVIYDTARSGITLQIVDGGLLEQVTISNISMRNVGNAFYLRLGDRNRPPGAERPGTMRQVVISNVVAEITGFGADSAYPLRAPRLDPLPNPLPSAIAGLPNAPIEDVILSNIQLLYRGEIHAKDRILSSDSSHLIPESTADYPEYDQFGELPAWALYLRHARGIILRDVICCLEGSDIRPAILADNVTDLKVDNVICRGPGDIEATHNIGVD